MAAAAEVAVEDEKAASSAVARAVEGESAVSAEGKLLQSELKLLNVPPVVLLVHESISGLHSCILEHLMDMTGITLRF